MITNTQSGTNIEEIAAGIFRINTPVVLPGDLKFNFNQYLIADDAPMLFHTGQRKLFPLVSEAIAAPAGLTVRVQGGNGTCVQRFFKRGAGVEPQRLEDIAEAS